MRQSHMKARLLRAISGMTQRQLAEEMGVHPSLISQIEQGRVKPGRHLLRRMALCAGFGESDLEVLWEWLEELLQARKGRRPLGETPPPSARERLPASACERLLALPDPGRPPRAEDRLLAMQQWESLKDLPEEAAQVVVRVADQYQNWALCEKFCDESECQTSRDLQRAAALARLALETARLIKGPEKWCKRVLGYATAHGPNVLRVLGDLRAAEAGFQEAELLWNEGSDPEGWLDPGRLADLEASLCRDQGRFKDALRLLDEAAAVGRSPARVLIKKGLTLEALGEYERALETLLQAQPLVVALADPRLAYMLRFNLAVNYCHVCRYEPAAHLLSRVRAEATERGDKNEVSRVIWLEGRIAAGLGHRIEARQLLAEARQRFASEGMSYDVGLSLLEEAVLLLEDGQTSAVKLLACELTCLFESKGVHREALAALRLFQEAAMREKATAEMARRVLRYLFRAQHDPELRFTAS